MAKKVKARVISVRLISMAMTGFFYQFSRPRTSPPMSMLKYDPVGKYYFSNRNGEVPHIDERQIWRDTQGN